MIHCSLHVAGAESITNDHSPLTLGFQLQETQMCFALLGM